jgi:hypothetical protein
MGMSQRPPSPGGVVDLTGDDLRHGWYVHKTLWAVSERYSGPVLIRGRRIDAPGRLRFLINGHSEVDSLEFPAERRDDWEWGISDTLLRSAGCYAFQLDGRSFSDMVVFKAVGPA